MAIVGGSVYKKVILLNGNTAENSTAKLMDAYQNGSRNGW